MNSNSRVMRNYFQLADKSKDKKLNQNEVNKFLQSINLKLKPDELKKLILVFDNCASVNFSNFITFSSKKDVRRKQRR